MSIAMPPEPTADELMLEFIKAHGKGELLAVVSAMILKARDKGYEAGWTAGHYAGAYGEDCSLHTTEENDQR